MRLLTLAIAGLVSFSTFAHADILGDTVHVQYDYPDMGSDLGDVGNFTVPSSGNAFGLANFTLSATQIVVTSAITQDFVFSAFNGLEFDDISGDPMITGASFDPLSTYTDGVISFTTNAVFLNLSNTHADAGQTAIIDLTFATPTPPSAVTPEPASFALLGTGLLGVAGTMRRRFVRG